jgi:predicted phage tail protein
LNVFNPGSPTRTGFIFGGWSPSVPTTITQSTQFVAQWTEEQGSNLPLAPSSVSISSPANNQVSISWAAVSGATSYQWELYLDGAFLEGGSTTSALSVSRSGIPAGQVQARVRACNANGCGPQQLSATITVSGVGLG